MEIKSLYLPQNSIQNDEFPGHVTWKKKDEIELILSMTSNVHIEEIFNVVPDSIEYLAENKIKINQFEINGYVGFVFKSKELLKKAKCVEEIEFYIRDLKSMEEKIFIKKIELFRPSVEVVKIPPKIAVGYNDDLKCFEFKDKIHIKNFGSGTAYLSVELVSNEDFNISMPDERENFIKKMVEGLEEELENLTKLYPNYSILINRFRSMIKEPPTLKDDVIEELRKLGDELSDTFENDEKFLDDFCRAYLNVYLKNLQLLTQIESFINYLNSIGKNKIILYNSTNMIKSSKTTGSLELLIYITDLNYNKYPVIKIPPIPISCETQFQIPIHSIFEFNNSVEGEK